MHSLTRETPKKVFSIQALRAFAVTWVVLDHAFPHLIPGGYIGVDVFFVISGFLITSHLLDHFLHDSFSFGSFYLKRAQRLLPAAWATLIATAVASFVFLPPAWLAETLTGTAMAAAYVVNWWLAHSSVNYFADSGIISPANHFWSLSVEEQFYLIWPALIWGVWRWAKRGGTKRSETELLRRISLLLLGLVVVSLGAAIVATDHNSTSAYFLTHTRAWEFALGALAGVAARHNGGAATSPLWAFLRPVSWAVLVVSGWAYTPQSGVPGPVVMPVVLAAAYLLWNGDAYQSQLTHRIIRWKPVQWLGDVSYSVYLWHWPMLVLAPFALQTERLSTLQVLGVLGATLIISAWSYTHIETRFRAGPPKTATSGRSFGPWKRLSVFAVLSGLIAVLILQGARWSELRTAGIAQELFNLSQNPPPCFGARATEPGADCPDSHKLAQELYALQNWDSQIVHLANGWVAQNEQGQSDVIPSFFGATQETATREIALLGDSHAGMWASALNMFVDPNAIRVTSYLASSCPATEDDQSFAYYLAEADREPCRIWRQDAAQAILSNPAIDTVVVSGAAYSHRTLGPSGWRDDTGAGFAALWQRFVAAGKRVVVIDDVPMLPFKLPECLARPTDQQERCSYPASSVPATTPLARAVALMPPGDVTYISFKDVFCDDVTCHSIIGGIPVYMDSDHISAPFARSLAARLAPLVLNPPD